MDPAPPKADYVYLPKRVGNEGCHTNCINYATYIYAPNLITGGAGWIR